jgi:hypothetical protein
MRRRPESLNGWTRRTLHGGREITLCTLQIRPLYQWKGGGRCGGTFETSSFEDQDVDVRECNDVISILLWRYIFGSMLPRTQSTVSLCAWNF